MSSLEIRSICPIRERILTFCEPLQLIHGKDPTHENDFFMWEVYFVLLRCSFIIIIIIY